ncbi:MAG: hypothetical protein HYY40_09045 [Bacteroidetes bacterium]|nr:hypothetical protein [Bacteroidota bacterium]
MKPLFFTAVIVFAGYLASAQTATSVQNGDFLNPLTWNCTCIPLPGYNITVNHTVTLDTNFWVPSGSLNIGTSGALIEDASQRGISVTGGTFTNNGTFIISRFATTGGTVTNNDSMVIKITFYNSTSLTNSKFIMDVDSFYNEGTFINSAGSYFMADNFWNNGNATNSGYVESQNFLNDLSFMNLATLEATDFANYGTFDNMDHIHGVYNFYNNGRFTNCSACQVHISNNFLNSDSSLFDAVTVNDGFIDVSYDWLNMDTVYGSSTGVFCVGDESTNSGYMTGNFSFCDVNPYNPPMLIDYNTGYFDTNITDNNCMTTCMVGINEGVVSAVDNPDGRITLFDVTGRMVFSTDNRSGNLSNGSEITAYFQNRLHLPAGIYYYRITGSTWFLNKSSRVSLFLIK